MSVFQPLSHAQLLSLKAELLRRDFKRFAQYFWPEVSSAKLVWEAPQEAIAKALQGFTTGTLVINVPPASAKSLLTSVLYPAWRWATDPTLSVVAVSHTDALVQKLSANFRNLVESKTYTELFPKVILSDDTNSKKAVMNTLKGERISTTPNGSITGLGHADLILVDDIIDASDAANAPAIAAANEWFDQTLMTRFKDQTKTATICIAQRLAAEDLPGLLLQRPETQHVNLPAINPDGTPLAPIRLPLDVLGALRVRLGTYNYSAQYSQNPIPMTGGIISKDWLDHSYTTLPPKFEKVAVIVDAASTGTSDPYAALVVGLSKAKLYALDYWCQATDFPSALAKLEALKTKYQPTEFCVEAASNGHALIQTFRNKWPNVIALQPKGSKLERLSAASPALEAGSFLFPTHAIWLNAFKAEVIQFPRAPHDESVDCLSYAINRYLGNSASSSMTVHPDVIGYLFS